ncbi:MAG: hypothetical protein ABSG64_02435 [Solirubrobacteraceae bacterium]
MSLPPRDPAHELTLRERCHQALAANWTTGMRGDVPFAYTRPSVQRYRWQWYWDSCFAAIAWRHLDPARSRSELETLLAAARDDGFIGHTIFWEGPVGGTRRLFYNVVRHDDPMTSTIQPPVLALAWQIAVGDPALEPAIVAHHAAIAAQRDLEGDGLVWILQPDESGLDASPQFDPIWGRRAQGLPGFIGLVHRNRRCRFRIDEVRARGGPVVCEVMTNVLHGLSQLALGRASITPALIARLYDERSGLFLPVADPPVTARIPLTWAALSPLALPDLPEAIGRRLVEQYLLDESRFWTAIAPPAVACDEHSFSLRERFTGLRRYWRGPTWINSAWIVWQGLVRLGYTQQAASLAERVTRAVREEGLREFYDPFDGRGMGAHDFTWSALALDFAG